MKSLHSLRNISAHLTAQYLEHLKKKKLKQLFITDFWNLSAVYFYFAKSHWLIHFVLVYMAPNNICLRGKGGTKTNCIQLHISVHKYPTLHAAYFQRKQDYDHLSICTHIYLMPQGHIPQSSVVFVLKSFLHHSHCIMGHHEFGHSHPSIFSWLRLKILPASSLNLWLSLS